MCELSEASGKLRARRRKSAGLMSWLIGHDRDLLVTVGGVFQQRPAEVSVEGFAMHGVKVKDRNIQLARLSHNPADQLGADTLPAMLWSDKHAGKPRRYSGRLSMSCSTRLADPSNSPSETATNVRGISSRPHHPSSLAVEVPELRFQLRD